MFLISNSVGWVVLDDSSSFQSGQVIQTLLFNPENSVLDNSSVSRGANVVIFSKTIRCRSNNSQIYATFDSDCRVNGGGTDYWGSYINIINLNNNDSKTVGAKYVNVNNDERNSSLNIFPLSGSRLNFTANLNYRIDVGVYGDSDDILNASLWNMALTEIEN
jgi:hypothetical protein